MAWATTPTTFCDCGKLGTLPFGWCANFPNLGHNLSTISGLVYGQLLSKQLEVIRTFNLTNCFLFSHQKSVLVILWPIWYYFLRCPVPVQRECQAHLDSFQKIAEIQWFYKLQKAKITLFCACWKVFFPSKKFCVSPCADFPPSYGK